MTFIIRPPADEPGPATPLPWSPIIGYEASRILKAATDILAAGGAAAMWALAWLLPPATASRTGAALIGWLGPRLRKHKHVCRNLRTVMPDATHQELQAAARNVWRNLGSVLFEYPHLSKILSATDAVSMPPSVRQMFEAAVPMMFVTAHVANWELLAGYVAGQAKGLVVVYNPDENPHLERLIQHLRKPSRCEYVGKHDALRRITDRYLQGRSVGLLLDVRVDTGAMVPLFGRDAPTTTSPFRMAQRLDYPVVPVRAKRAGPARFEIEFYEPLAMRAGAGSAKTAAVEMARQFNRLLETWITERPGEWLCTKRRWPKNTTPSASE